MPRPTIGRAGPVRGGSGYILAVLLLNACESPQSTLAPDGPAAATIAQLWWLFLAISTGVSLAVFAALLYALFRPRSLRGERPPLPLSPDAEKSGEARNESADDERRGSDRPTEVWLDTAAEDRRSVRWVVAAGVGATGLIVLGLLLVTLRTLGALSDRDTPPGLTIEVTGWQWWWQVRYLDPQGAPLFETANEIHVPVGERVRVRLKSRDVIHSFWVPRLAGKLDMIPGRTNTLWIQADREGVYRGQCAEYCAGPHALMSFLVIAQPEEEFQRWLEQQRRPARSPSESEVAGHQHASATPGEGQQHEHGPDVLLRGQQVFLQSDCADCHTIRGTSAAGEVGPDLTHLASRRTLAAVTVPNTKGHLGGWITSPQSLKPGSKMPSVALDSEAMLALLHYLESLR